MNPTAVSQRGRPAWGERRRALLSLPLVLALLAAPAAGAQPLPPLHPHDLQGHLVRARLLYRRGDVSQALTTLQSALKVDPQFGPAHHLLGSIYLSQRQYRPALQQFRKETQLQPRSVGGYFGLAGVYYGQRQYPAAISALQKVLTIEPQQVQAHAKLGVIYANQMHADKALLQFRKALSLDPNAHFVHYYLGDLLRKLSRTDEALPHLQQAIALNPDVPIYFLSLGQLYLQRPQTAENGNQALLAFGRAIQLDPGLASAHYGMGLVYRRQQQWPEAERSLRQALVLNPDLGEAHYALAGVLRKRGKSAEARQHLVAFRRFRATHVRPTSLALSQGGTSP